MALNNATPASTRTVSICLDCLDTTATGRAVRLVHSLSSSADRRQTLRVRTPSLAGGKHRGNATLGVDALRAVSAQKNEQCRRLPSLGIGIGFDTARGLVRWHCLAAWYDDWRSGLHRASECRPRARHGL